VSPDEASFTAGSVLDGRYRLERPLGDGGMGTVWVARQLVLGREVAIKSFRAGRTHDQARLEREARLLASVRHPCIVQIFDFVRGDTGRGYVVMELVAGPSLEARLEAGPFACEEAVRLLLPLLDGLAVVHAAGIVHRDIKPANIVLAHEGPEGAQRIVPKLLDFGIARNDEAALTQEGVVVGTPAYMAPEQFLGSRGDPRADVWAVAATFYDLVAGQPPFSGDSLFDLMRKVSQDPLPFPRHAVGLDGKLWSVMTDAMRKDPSERIQSALALRDRLLEWLTLRGASTRASSPGTVQAGPDAVAATQAPTVLVTPVAAPEPGPESFDALINERLRER
jgi:serine/threonine protein kinase